mmetsp:Transcript_26990/g.75442  ORF Transcript_26990/g.75442 Transcript_26990/m.75442 type:complete len:137 (+) Transcript_26990:1248-1658(+)
MPVTTMAVSPLGNVVATGNSSGILNLYGRRGSSGDRTFFPTGAAPEPQRAFPNLTHSLSGCRFNHDGSMVAYWSERTKQAVRLVHVPTATVFDDFPGRVNLHYVTDCAFSPGSGFLAAGTGQGRVLLFRLPRYSKS